MRRITKIKITEQTEEPMVAPRRTLYGESFFFMAAIPLLLCSEPMSTINMMVIGSALLIGCLVAALSSSSYTRGHTMIYASFVLVEAQILSEQFLSIKLLCHLIAASIIWAMYKFEQTGEPTFAIQPVLRGERFFFLAMIPLLLCSDPM